MDSKTKLRASVLLILTVISIGTIVVLGKEDNLGLLEQKAGMV